jgi:uncharacterized membrane protein YagU involved in acid resistance
MKGTGQKMNSPTSVIGLNRKSRALPAIFWAGLLCGVMDISAAFITWYPKGIMPARILRGVAAGLLGPSALKGGWPIALLGLAIHFFVAYSAATVFYLASRKLTFMVRQPFIYGPIYGILVYTFMYWVVMPLSARPPGKFSWTNTIVAILTHIVCVGTPIAFVESRFSR